MTLVVALVLEIWLLTGVALDQVVPFLGYELAFVALPGVAVLWALRGKPRGFLELIGLGMPIGFTLEILAFSATAAAGARTLFLAYPVVVTALAGLVAVRQRRESSRVAGAPPISPRVMWMAALALAVGLVYVALIFIPQAPLPTAGGSVSYIPDFVYEMSKTAEVLHHWPATNPGLSGVPLPYEWFVFFHMAAVSQVTHLSIPIVALRLDFVPIVLIIGCQLLMLGRALSGTAATGVIAIVVLFLLGPLDLTTDSAGASPFFSVFSVDLSVELDIHVRRHLLHRTAVRARRATARADVAHEDGYRQLVDHRPSVGWIVRREGDHPPRGAGRHRALCRMYASISSARSRRRSSSSPSPLRHPSSSSPSGSSIEEAHLSPRSVLSNLWPGRSRWSI